MQCFQSVESKFIGFAFKVSTQDLIRKFLGDHKLIKATAAETVEEFTVL